MSNLKLIFAGSGEFGLPTLRALKDAGHEIVQVYSQPDRPSGRGRKLTPTPISQFALEQGLAITRTGNINAEPLPQADLLIVIAFGQKIADAVVHHCRLGSVNLHASILPKYRGAAPINAAIMAGETLAGNSIIRLAQKMDAGDVLAQSKIEIGELETAGELHDRLALDGAPLMLKTINQLADGTAVETPQDHSQATLAPKLSRETTRIDWNLSANQIARTLRGLYPWPACRFRLLDSSGAEINRLTLFRTRPAPSSSSAGTPGTISSDFSIHTGHGSLSVIELQPEGKRPMPLDAFRNGHRWEADFALESIA